MFNCKKNMHTYLTIKHLVSCAFEGFHNICMDVENELHYEKTPTQQLSLQKKALNFKQLHSGPHSVWSGFTWESPRFFKVEISFSSSSRLESWWVLNWRCRKSIYNFVVSSASPPTHYNPSNLKSVPVLRSFSYMHTTCSTTVHDFPCYFFLCVF